jgi:hypothetical protein
MASLPDDFRLEPEDISVELWFGATPDDERRACFEIVRRYNAHEALVAALEKYGRHELRCPHSPMNPKCLCGYDAALAAARVER